MLPQYTASCVLSESVSYGLYIRSVFEVGHHELSDVQVYI